MESQQTTEQQLLAEEKKQTAALESLRGIALVAMSLAAAVLVIWLIALFVG